MKYKLISPINSDFSVVETILTNRGIHFEDIEHYLNTTDNDINDYNSLGKDKIEQAAILLGDAVATGKRIFMPIDCDCDGYTACALILNYLHEVVPAFVENNITWWHHSGKQHGLQDCINEALKYDLVMCLDSSSNDYNEHKQLKENGIPVIVLDHHEADTVSENAIVINNQLSDYPNKDFCGCGITWQFCRYLDTLFGCDNANRFLDLVALGNCGDMMSRRSIETKHLMDKGFQDENITNPFIYYMAEKNSYSLGGSITPIGAAFYIVPFINAVTRSGTQEEKELLFDSMLTFKAFEMIPSTKRGCKGQTEKLVEQAVRTVTNVKNRQTKLQTVAMELLEGQIEQYDMMQHKVLFFMMKQGEIANGLAGLAANKLMAKYQRPCCILTETTDENNNVVFQGSARGYSKSGIKSFAQICEKTEAVQYVAGHDNAFGLGVKLEDVPAFIERTDEILKDMRSEPIFDVDFLYKGAEVNPEVILAIADLNGLWGQDIDEPFVAIEGLVVTPEMVTVYSKRNNTLKITLQNGISLIKFNATDDECEMLQRGGSNTLNIVGRCNKNEWCGIVTPQLFIEDYDVIKQNKYCF